MKNLRWVVNLLFLITILLISSCQNDKKFDGGEKFTCKQIVITENKPSDAGTTFYGETYCYSSYLDMYKGYSTHHVDELSNRNNFTVNFQEDKNIYEYADEQGNHYEYGLADWLNDKPSYAVWTYKNSQRRYVFEYQQDSLSLIKEFIDGELFSTTNFDYVDDLNTTITFERYGVTGSIFLKHIEKSKPSPFINYFLMEYHPFDKLKHGIYAGLFKFEMKPISEITCDLPNEKTIFEYGPSIKDCDILPQYCTQTIVNNGRSYTRTVSFEFENVNK